MKHLIKSNISYLIIHFFQAGINFLMIFFFINNFTVAEYGIFSLMNGFLAFITLFIAFNLESAMQTFFFDYQSKTQLLEKYITNIISTALISVIMFFVIILFTGPYLFNLLFSNTSISFFPYGFLVLITGGLVAVNQIYYVILKNKQDISKYGKLVVVNMIIAVCIQIYLIAVHKYGVLGALIGPLISNAVLFIWLVIKKNLITFHLDFTIIKSSLGYCLWFLPSLFMQWFLSKGDRFIIERFISLETVGTYALLINFSILISLIATAILNSYRPTLYGLFKSSKGRLTKSIYMLLLYYLIIILLASCFIYIIVQNLKFLGIAPSYLQIQNFIFLALALFIIRVTLRFLYEYFYYLKKSKELTLFSILNVLLFIALIVLKRNGLDLSTFLKIHIFNHSIILVLISCRIYYLSMYLNEGR